MHVGSWTDHQDAIERMLAACVAAGKSIEYPPDRSNEKPMIRAEWIRQLLLGQRERSHHHPAPRSGGVRIKGARIVGQLHLEDCACSNEMLPALALEHCDILDDLNLEGSRIARLCLRGSRFRKIMLREAEIGGHFNFAGCRPFKDHDGNNQFAWIDARGAIINGEVTGSGGMLQLPPKRDEKQIEPEGPRYALWLAGADIRGNVRLNQGFTAHGGISLDGAQVHGHLWCDGAKLTAIEDDAFNAQSARISGNLMLRAPLSAIGNADPEEVTEQDTFNARGSMWLLGAHIGGYLDLRYARIELSPGDDRNRAALVIDQADIGATVLLRKATIRRGHLSFVGTRVRGSLDCSGLRLLGLPDSEHAFIGSSMEIGDSAQFDTARFESAMDMAGARIGGNLSFDGTLVQRALSGNSNCAINALNISIEGNASFGPSKPTSGRRIFNFMADGMIDFTGAKVAGDLLFRQATLRNYTNDGKSIAFKAERAQTAGSMEFRDHFVVDGEVDLSGASIGQDLKCVEGCFANPCDDATYGSAIYAKDLQVGDDVQLFNTKVYGNLRFERMQVTGSVHWDKLTIGRWRNPEAPAPLDLRYTRIGSVLKAYRLSFQHPRSGIDLRGATASMLDCYWPEGWGGVQDCRNGADCPINLDGFSYERLSLQSSHATRRNDRLRRWWNIPTGLSAPPANRRGDHLLDWLLHQPRHDAAGASADSSQTTFFPQPFRQLARVLQAQGEEEPARTVAIAERWAAPMESAGQRLLRRLYGFFFGFGLSGTRANATLIFYIALGAIGVDYAQSQNMLVESTVVTASQYTEPYDGWDKRVFVKVANGGGFDVDLACTDTASNFATDVVYALDMIVPFIPLHQETKCEIRSDPGVAATIWRVAKGGYSLLGWIVFSVWLVTFYGRLKRPEPEN